MQSRKFFSRGPLATMMFVAWIGSLLILPANLFAQTAPAEPATRSTAPTTKKEAVIQADQRVELKIDDKEAKKPKNGWFPKMTLGLNTSLVHSASVPGLDDGVTMNIGIVIDGGLLLRHFNHEWKSTFKLVHAQTKTPTIDPFVKTADNLDIQSFYIYRFRDKWDTGLHIGFQLNTALFDGNLVVNKDTPLRILDYTGKEVSQNLAKKNEPFFLTRGFSPLILKQKLGIEFTPHADKYLKLELKFDGVAQEVVAGGNTVADDALTPQIELKQLRTYFQAGVEFDIELSGKVNKYITYTFSAELMYPLITSIPTELNGFDLLNADLSLKVSFKLAKWASLDYVFSAKLIPLLVDKWQVVNNLVLSLKADIL